MFQASKNMQGILKMFVSMCIIRKKKNEGHEHRAEKEITIQDRKKTMTKKQAENRSYPKVM